MASRHGHFNVFKEMLCCLWQEALHANTTGLPYPYDVCGIRGLEYDRFFPIKPMSETTPAFCGSRSVSFLRAVLAQGEQSSDKRKRCCIALLCAAWMRSSSR